MDTRTNVTISSSAAQDSAATKFPVCPQETLVRWLVARKNDNQAVDLAEAWLEQLLKSPNIWDQRIASFSNALGSRIVAILSIAQRLEIGSAVQVPTALRQWLGGAQRIRA